MLLKRTRVFSSDACVLYSSAPPESPRGTQTKAPMARVMQREREVFYVGALTNVAAGERVVIFVIRNCLVPVA